MALQTFGTDATSTLSALAWNKASPQVDIAEIAKNIKDDLNPAHPIWPGAFSNTGYLFVPNRGILRCMPGDVIAYGATGWPILVSAAEVASDWTLT